jgi:hypothetical protein
MKNLFTKVLLAALVLVLAAAPASANGFAVYGTWWDTDEADDAAGVGANYHWNLGEVVDLELRAAWYEELEDEPLEQLFSGSNPIDTGITVIPIELGFRFNFARDSDFWNPWAGGGGAYYALDSETGNLDDEIGFYGLVGSTFGNGEGIDLYTEVGYRFVEGEVTDFDLDGDSINDTFDVNLNGPFAGVGIVWEW